MKIHIKKELGNIGEQIAVEYLEKKRYQILERNFYCRQGEIDIIATEQNQIIFVEVKARTNVKYGRPAEAVNSQKQAHIVKTAQYYVCKNTLENKKIRFDVV